MDKKIRDSLNDISPDSPAAEEAKKRAFPVPYIREGTLAGELEAALVNNNGFTVILPEWTAVQPNAREIFFIIYAENGPMPELTELMPFDGMEIIHYVGKDEIDSPFLRGNTVTLFGIVYPEAWQTARTSYQVI